MKKYGLGCKYLVYLWRWSPYPLDQNDRNGTYPFWTHAFDLGAFCYNHKNRTEQNRSQPYDFHSVHSCTPRTDLKGKHMVRTYSCISSDKWEAMLLCHFSLPVLSLNNTDTVRAGSRSFIFRKRVFSLRTTNYYNILQQTQLELKVFI